MDQYSGMSLPIFRRLTVATFGFLWKPGKDPVHPVDPVKLKFK